ncbi:hypothetical protein [Paenisporosarcina sp. TG20]|uniref:hypothetical protein n=1 Tax=Paenisporosarcina sp. TG20 TaxID=1211706 RepID=UPI0012F66682|nr:hypothetical protein [Paenisporosarcina sp. TG20]
MKNSEQPFRNKHNKQLISTIFLIALGITIYTLLSIDNDTYKLLWLLPLGYLLFTLIYYGVLAKINYNYGVVFITANIIIFIRYVITPFSIVFSSSYNGLGFGPNPSESSMSLAIALMLLELLVVYFITIFAVLHYSKKQKSYSKINSIAANILNNKSIVVLFMLVALPIVLVLSPDALMPNSLSSIGSNTDNFSDIQYSGLLLLIIPMIRLVFLLLSLSFIKGIYDKKNKGIAILLAWLVVFFYLSMLISTSRWSIVFSSILCMLVIAQLFPKTPKIFYGILISMTVIVFAAISIYKFSWALDSSLNPYRDIFNVLFGQFQEYFSGPRVVAQSLDMTEFFGSQIGISTIMNDFLGSLPFISNFIDQTDRTNIYFNLYLEVGNVSHIIPLLGNSYAYLPLFPVFFTIIAQWLMVRFDFKSQNEKQIEFKYIYGYIGLFFAMSMGFNVQIIFGNFIAYFLFPWLLFTLNRRFTLKSITYNSNKTGGS